MCETLKKADKQKKRKQLSQIKYTRQKPEQNSKVNLKHIFKEIFITFLIPHKKNSLTGSFSNAFYIFLNPSRNDTAWLCFYKQRKQ